MVILVSHLDNDSLMIRICICFAVCKIFFLDIKEEPDNLYFFDKFLEPGKTAVNIEFFSYESVFVLQFARFFFWISRKNLTISISSINSWNPEKLR